MTDTQAKNHYTVKWITVTALFMALNVVMSSFGLPVPGGHLYLNDVIICTAAILLDPVGAFAVGGIGAFLGDFFFYPTPMFVSLVVHGLQAVVISLCTRKLFRGKNDGKGKPVARVNRRRDTRRDYHGRRILARASVHLFYSGLRDSQAPVPDSSGGCRRRRGRYHRLQVRAWEALR